LQLASSDFDTFLFLFDSACVPVAANDDCSDGVLNSCLGIGLAAGTYFIGVNSFQAGERGAYTLSVSAPDCNACPTCQVGTVVCNESVTGSLRTSGCQLPGAGPADFWRLTLAAESELQISLESTAFDPLLAVLDASCRPGERNDDCDPNTLNSCLRVTLPAGEHFIAATSFLAGEGGAYTLTVSCAGEGTRPGDASGDGRLGIADGLVLLRYLFADAPERLPCGDGAGIHPANLQLLDFNGNGRLNTADAIGLILYLFGQGSPHARGVDCTSIADCPSRCFSG
jgi:hypothetical protein